MRDLDQSPLECVPHLSLLQTMVTADARLARARGITCRVDLMTA